ncbi:MAG: hypothetical protein HY438_00190 [DPANN group archaeon]|nr:hypothetical protein [DPANN group archaeon]
MAIDSFNAIVISAMPKAGASSVAAGLASHYGWAHYSAGDEFKKLSANPNELAAAVEVWQGKGKDKGLHDYLNDRVTSQASAGGIVIDAKLGIYLTRHLPNVITIWLKTEFNKRVELAIRKSGGDYDSVKQSLTARTQMELQEWAQMYPELGGYFEQEYRAHIVLENNGTLEDAVRNAIAQIGLVASQQPVLHIA